MQPLFDTLGLSPEAAQFTALAIAFSLISFLHIVLGELAPKTMAIRHPERMSLWTAAPLYVFYWLMYPAIWVLNTSANRFLRLLGWGELEHHSHRYSREELMLIVGRQDPNAVAPDQGLALMSHALELPDLVAGDLMRPREHMRSLREGMNLEAVLAEFSASRYSHYPWFDADGEQVLGILHTKDLLVAMARGRDLEDLRPLLRRPHRADPGNADSQRAGTMYIISGCRRGTRNCRLLGTPKPHGRRSGCAPATGDHRAR